jgi:hypothetical protein
MAWFPLFPGRRLDTGFRRHDVVEGVFYFYDKAAKAGIHIYASKIKDLLPKVKHSYRSLTVACRENKDWIPAFAGMTKERRG